MIKKRLIISLIVSIVLWVAIEAIFGYDVTIRVGKIFCFILGMSFLLKLVYDSEDNKND
jgi:hypothetical protein